MSDLNSNFRLVDPELRPMLDAYPTVSVTAELLPLMRQRPPWFEINPADRERANLEDVTVPGPTGSPDVDIRIYRPNGEESPLPCIFHIHGGGYIAGSAKDLAGIHLPIAADLRCCIVSVEYRLAPEAPYPAAIEDCYAALAWVFTNSGRLNLDSSRIGVMGESAGGGLAAALALMVRDRGEYTLAFQHLVYPMLDDRTCTSRTLIPTQASLYGPPEATTLDGPVYLAMNLGKMTLHIMPYRLGLKISLIYHPLI